MFTIMTNPTAIGAQGAVNAANGTLSKTIQQLSTGLRINTAADDASGLAVSEKLRGQISGLKVAARNAQDGISFLQTAEAAMGTMTSMVQRIRELAVQAGDPAYTTSDRVMLQTEVDQLKEEINRVSASSEFNTKKLLNGDASALWSATGGIEAIVKGSTVEGNYNVTTALTPGLNDVYKTNVMSIKGGETSFDIVSEGSGLARLDNIKNVLTNANTDINFKVTKANYTAVGAAVTAIMTNSLGGAVTTAGIGINNEKYAVELEALKDRVAGATAGASIRYRVTNSLTGKSSEWQTADISAADAIISTTVSATFTSVGIKVAANVIAGISVSAMTTGGTARLASTGATLGEAVAGTTKQAASYGSLVGTGAITAFASTNLQFGSAAVEMEALSDKIAGENGKLRYRVTNMATGTQSDWYEFTVTKSGAYTTVADEGFGNKALVQVGLDGTLLDNTAGTKASITATAFKKGDKFLLNMSGANYVKAADIAAANTSGGLISVGTSSATVAYSSLYKASYENSVKLYTAQMDASGKVHYGSMDALMNKAAVTKVGTSISTIRLLGSGDAASTYTKLGQVATFTNADGRNVLNNTQELTIYGNNKKAVLTLEKEDTIEDFQKKFASAIIDQLDMGAGGSGVNANLVNFIKAGDVTSGGNQAVKGTFIIQSAKLGGDSSLSFSGDQGIITGLGFQNIQKGADSKINATVTNAHTGDTIGSDLVSDGVLRNVIKNIDIKLDQTIGSTVAWDDVKKQLTFTPDGVRHVSTLHLVNNATIASIGPNEGQTLDISIGRMDALSLNISNVDVLTLENSQKAITKLDQALDTINKGRAVMGAQMNRLDFTMNNLNVSRENMMAAESRIRDLDIAEASSSLASKQVRLQAATAMLAQANQLPSYAAQLLR